MLRKHERLKSAVAAPAMGWWSGRARLSDGGPADLLDVGPVEDTLGP
jgi:hypothetical protein